MATHRARHRGLKRPAFVLQSLAFPRSTFTSAEACRWAARHGYRCKGVETTAGHYRVRQLPPRAFRRLRTIALGDAVRAVGGPLRNPVDIEPPEGGIPELLRFIPDLGEPAIKTVSWKEIGGIPGARVTRRRTRRVKLAPKLADVARVARAARDYVKHAAKSAGAEAGAREARRVLAGPRVASLSTFVRAHGGILVPKGHPLRGEASRLAGLAKARGVVKRSGKGKLPGHMAELAAEAGYPIERGSETQILEAIEREAMGQGTMRPLHANPSRLTSNPHERYNSSARPVHKVSAAVARRNSKGQFTGSGRKSNPKKGKKGKRRSNPTGAEEVALMAINPGKKKRKHNPGGFVKSITGSLMPSRVEIARGFGLVASDFAGNLVQSKLFKKDPTSLLARLGAMLGGAIGGKILARGASMVPVAGIKSAAPHIAEMAWPGAVYRGVKTIAIPAIPEGKIKATLSEWGLRGGAPYEPAHAYLMDAENGASWELDGCNVRNAGRMAGVGGAQNDDEEDLSGDDAEDLDGLAGELLDS
jgi:hypothetical protein